MTAGVAPGARASRTPAGSDSDGSATPSGAIDPRVEYRARLAARRASLETSERQHRVLSRVRLATFVVGLAIAWLVLDRAALPPLALLLPVLAFVGLVFRHGRVTRERDRLRGAVRYYERGLARLGDTWPGLGPVQADFVAGDHPYAADLDLFGRGSLFDLVCDARTRTGERVLASWLAAPAAPEVVRERQAAVAELRPRLDLREALASSGAELRAEVAPDRLVEWGKRPATLTGFLIPIAAALLSALTIATLVLAMRPGASISPFIVAAGLQTGFLLLIRTRMDSALRGVDRAARDLTLLRAILLRLERESFTSPLLSRLAVQLRHEGAPAARLIRGLQLRMELNDSGRNLFFLPISLLLLWPVQLGCVIDRWRARHGGEIGRWIDALAELEALSSLAGYAWEHPDDVFPDVVGGGPLLDATGVGHPLIAESRCVRNDLSLGETRRALIVSGSNMSGKSTMLRAVGLNVALALAGAPVRARSFRLSPLAIGASIRIADSLLDGRSHFQAEILRLKQITDIARGPLPLLFLLDEILHGTNSHDRCIGSEAVLFHLLEHGAIGLVTTHDLALASMVERAPRPVENVHFEDHVEDGAMVFDYRMREGVVQKSNALALMRAAGLDV